MFGGEKVRALTPRRSYLLSSMDLYYSVRMLSIAPNWCKKGHGTFNQMLELLYVYFVYWSHFQNIYIEFIIEPNFTNVFCDKVVSRLAVHDRPYHDWTWGLLWALLELLGLDCIGHLWEHLGIGGSYFPSVALFESPLTWAVLGWHRLLLIFFGLWEICTGSDACCWGAVYWLLGYPEI